MAALHRILHLQPQMRRHRMQVDPFVPGCRIVLVTSGVLVDVRAALFLPADAVPEAEGEIRVHPQVAVGDPAIRWWLGLDYRRLLSHPPVRIRACCALPGVKVLRAQTPFLTAAAAAGHPAGRERLVAFHPRVGDFDEVVEIRLSLVPPSAVMPEAQPVDASGALATGNPASGSAQNGIVRTKASTSVRNCGRTAPSNFSSSPTYFEYSDAASTMPVTNAPPGL